MSRPIFLYFSAFCLASLVLISCAKTGNLYGGPEDKQPPQINEKKSTPNYQTNFAERQIILQFDEFVEIKNIDKEVLISPPMEKNPKINQRGKKITVIFDEEEVLREDATYSIQFGESIRDFTAGNILKDYKFVFATGDQLDSLTFSGQVVDAFTGDPVEKALIMLYDKLSDSIVAQERPFYLMKTDKEGKFKLENLRQDTFKVVALKDVNVNYKYDLDAEGIGFMDSTIMLTDSLSIQPTVSLFYKELPTKLVSKDFKTFGKLVHIFSSEVDSSLAEYSLSDPAPVFVREEISDTLTLWYTSELDSFTYSIAADTFKVYPRPRDSIFDARDLTLTRRQTSLPTWGELTLTAMAPIAEVDTSKIKLYQYIPLARPPERDSSVVRDSTLRLSESMDSIGSKLDTLAIVPDTTTTIEDSNITNQEDSQVDEGIVESLTDTAAVVLDSIAGQQDSVSIDELPIPIDTIFQNIAISHNVRTLSISSTWKEAQKYTINLLPGAVTDIYGRSNDSLSVDFTVAKENEYASIGIGISGTADSLSYVVELLKADVVVAKKYLAPAVDTLIFAQLQIAEYSIRLIEDLNNDKKWTTGSYWDSRQPERLQVFKLDKMQPGFDLDGKIKWLSKAAIAKAKSDEEEEDEQERKEAEEEKNNDSPTDAVDKPKLGDE